MGSPDGCRRMPHWDIGTSHDAPREPAGSNETSHGIPQKSFVLGFLRSGNVYLTKKKTAAISYGKPVLKTENEGFNTFAGVFNPGNGRIGPAFLEVPPVISGEASSCNGSGG